MAGSFEDKQRLKTTLKLILLLCTISIVTKLAPASEKVLDRWDFALYDLLMRKLVKPSGAVDRIATIAITQEDLNYYQEQSDMSWPWARQLYSNIIGYCKKGEAKALMLDLLYTDYSRFPGDDRAFIDTGLTQWDGVYLVGEFQENRPKELSEKDVNRLDKYAKELSIPARVNDPKVKIREIKYIRFPIEEYIAVNKKLVDTTDLPYFDGISRSYNLLSKYKDYYFPNFALRVLWEEEGHPEIIIEDGYLTCGSYRIPVDNKGAMNLKFYGKGRTTFKTYEAREVIQNYEVVEFVPEEKPTFPPEEFKDKYILLGTYIPGIDLKKVSVDLKYPGVEVHATALANIKSGDFIIHLPRLWVILWSLLYIPVSCFTYRYVKAFLCKYALYFLVAFHVGITIFLFTNNIWVGIIPQGSALLSSFIASVALNYVQEGKQKALVKKTFKSYVSPKVVDKILDRAGDLNLMGESKRLTVMFLDFEGFTSVSERLEPTELVKTLRTYFTHISNQVFATEGVIDKFIGDAVIAFWGDPLPQDDHEIRACRSALLIRKELIKLRKETHHELFARVGINTEQVVVGNMGSDTLFNYTVIGDGVNFASRLEGANKYFGTRILISETTYSKAKDHVLTREIGLLQVKGKEKSVRIYELAGIKGDIELIDSDSIKRYEEALSYFKRGAFHDANKLFERLSKSDREDKLVDYFCRLSAQLSKGPSSINGEFVHKLTSK